MDRIARAWMTSRDDDTLGRIVLHAHQREAAARLRTMLRAGGALLADPVGTGKTFTALAAARDARRLLIVAPAALRDMWTRALASADMHAVFASYESLSRGQLPDADADVVIADEAHHLRNPSTIRYGIMARLCARASVLLLSATPVHNRTGDLRAQLALFLGRRAWRMNETALAAHIVKRADHATSADKAHGVPSVSNIRWFDTGDDARTLRGILRLPAPIPPEDGGDGGVLLTLSLVRQWASSRAALQSALRARQAQTEALLSAFAGSRYPTRAQLRSWCYADGALQLAFPQLTSDTPLPDDPTLMHRARVHLEAVQGLRRELAASPDPDEQRGAALQQILHRHADARVVVFAEFAATVKVLYTRLAPLGGIAMLTGRGGQVAGGAVTRTDILEQFSPDATRRIPDARRIRALITTDLLSEGVNLQQASVVVHADLPWSPARAEQRVGRVRRMGSRHAEVFVYGLRAPASADHLLRLEARLRAKVAAASRVVGIKETLMPQLFPGSAPAAPPTLIASAELSRVLRGWQRSARHDGEEPVVAGAVAGACSGFLAVVDWGQGPTLIAGDSSDISDAPERVLATARACSPNAASFSDAQAKAVNRRILDWCASRRALAPLSNLAQSSPVRHRLLRRIDAIARRAPRHLRARYVDLARAARRAATVTLSAGAEVTLRELSISELPNAEWLSAVQDFVNSYARDAEPSSVRVSALLLLVPSASRA